MSEQYRPPTRRTIFFGALAALGGGTTLASEKQESELSSLERDRLLVQQYASAADMYSRRFPDIVSAARPYITESKSALEKAYWWADMLHHRKRVGASHASIVDAENWIRAYRHTARETLNKVPNEFHTFTQLQMSEPQRSEKRRRARKRRRR